MSVPVLQGHLRVTLADTPTLKQIGAHNTIKTVIVKKGMTMGDAAAQLIPKISRGLSTDIKGTVDQECSSYEFYGRHQETKALIKVELEDEALDWIPTGSKGAIYKVEFRPKGEKETTSNKRQTLRVLGKPKTSLSSEDSQSAEPGDLLSFARGSQQHPKPLPDSEPRHQSVDILSFVRSGGGGSSSGGPVLDDSELDAMSFLRSKKTVGTVPPEKKKRSKYGALRGKGEAPFSQSQSKLDVGKTAKAAGAVGFLSLGGDGVDGEDIFGPTEDSQETSNSKGGAMGFMDFFDRDSVPQAPISEPKSTRGGGGLSDDGQSIYFPLPTIDPKKKKEIYNTLSIASIRAQKNERDEELRSKGVPELRAATLHRMIEIFCCPPVCTEKFQRGMLLTIPTYTTPQDFLTEIIAVYDLSSLGNSNRDMREGVENLLTLWMGSYYSDFEGPEVQSLMATFLKELENNPTHQNMATFQKLNEEIKSSKLSHQQLQSQRASVCYNEWFGLDASGKDLNYFEAEEIADTLTFYTARIFMDLQEREHIAWMRGKKDAHPHIDLMIETFNRVSSWVSRELVIRPHLKDRVDAFEKLVLVAVRLDDKKNFQCLKALISGLNASCVRRMERTFREISADSLRKLDELTNKVSFENNFKTYRAFMETVMPPCIPFLGMFQKDFIFLNDGNPDHIGPLLNFSKRMRLAEIIGDISCCQMGNFHVNPTPQVIAYICSLPIVSEKDLHLLSRRVDPKDPEMVIAEMMEGEHELVTRVQELERKLEEANRQIEALHAKLNEKQETPSSMVAISSSQAEEKRRRQSILRKVQRNLPSDPSRWSVFDVGSWIARLVGDRWADAFIENSVLGADLVEMKLRELNLFVDDEDVSKVIYYGLKKMQEGCDPEKVLELHQNCCLVPAESDEEDGDHIRFSDESSLDFDTSLQSSLQSSGTYKLPGILDQNYQPTPPKIPPKPQSQPQPQPQPQSQLQPQLQPQPQPPQPQPQPQPRPLPANKSSSASNLKVPKPRASSFKSSGFSSSSSSFPTTTTSLGGSCSTSPPTSSRVSSPRGTSPTPIPSKTSPPASPPTSPALSSSASSSPASSSLASSPPTSSPPPSAPPRVTSVSPANPRKLPDPQVPSRRSETQSRMQPAQFSVQPPSSQTFSSIPRPSSSLTSSETTPGSPQSYRLSHSPQPARPGGPISPPPIQIGVDEQPQGKPPKVGSGVNRNSPLPVPPRGTPGNLPGSDPGVVRVAQRSNKIMVGGGGTGSGGIVRGRGISVGRGGRGRPLPQPNQQQPQ